jgi:hypothetical protein
VIAFGLLSMLVSAAAGTYVAWQNRHTVIRAQVGSLTWTGHLDGVLVIGALLACWFLLGAAFIQCRIAERRRARRTTPTSPAAQAAEDAPAVPRRDGASQRSAVGTEARAGRAVLPR